MKLLAPAKVNLHLAIAAREKEEKLHRLLSLFAPLSLADEIELRASAAESPRLRLNVVGEDLPEDRGNIAYRAAEAWLRSSGLSFTVEISLKKYIPMAAGLGGGSSDAAAVLRGLQSLAGTQALPREKLLSLALELGSDVPYFLRGGLALVSGHGEELEVLGPADEIPLLLYLPDAAIASGDAFQALDEGRGRAELPPPPAAGEAARENIRRIAAAPELWDQAFSNDFEALCFSRLPQLAEAAERLKELGSFFVRLSGSGPSLFALFADSKLRDLALAAFQEGPWQGRLFSLSLASLCYPRLSLEAV